jgi:DNA polymerase-4/DNA polymerase V
MFCTCSFEKAIAHIDADAFFVACECALNPSLKGKSAVTGKERGIVTALSYEAKAKGIKRGMRIYQAKEICKDLIVLESNYGTYSLFSVSMFEILRRFSPQVDEYSIDEAFVDLTGLRRLFSSSYEEIAKKIQSTIMQELSLSVSIGVSLTKVLAKIASKKNKPYGICIIDGKSIEQNLQNLAIEDVWGIGPNTASLLIKFDIKTALDFANKPENFVKKYLSKPYYEIWQELRGESVLSVISTPKSTYKSISKAKSFVPTNNESFIYAHLTKNLENACAKARMFDLSAKKVIVCLRDNSFNTHCIKLKLSRPTAYPTDIIHFVKQAFNALYTKNTLYRQTAVVLNELTTHKEFDLFDNVLKLEKTERLYNAIDEINKRFGKAKVCLASSAKACENNFPSKRLALLNLNVKV